MNRILVINPGSTSTKLAIFEDKEMVKEVNLKMDEEFVRRHNIILEQVDHRTELIVNFMEENGYKIEDFDIVAARGGFVPPCQGGTYAVNQLMLDVLRYASTAQHASNLGALIGHALSGGKIPVIICDSVVTDEMRPIAKVTGLPTIRKMPAGHVLNTRHAAKEVAEKLGKDFNECSFVVAHMGGGSSVCAYEKGLLVDMDTDMMTPQRSGKLPNGPLIDMCFSGKYTREQVHKMTIPEGGFYAYIGTQDALEAENRAKAGDETCQMLYEAMAYHMIKIIGSMYACLGCRVDALVLTGALARSPLLVEPITKAFESAVRVEVIPGERELQGLASAALAVMEGREVAKEYTVLPENCATVEEFYKFVESKKAEGK